MFLLDNSDGGEIEEEKKQGFAYKDGFSYTHEGHVQQVCVLRCCIMLSKMPSIFEFPYINA